VILAIVKRQGPKYDFVQNGLCIGMRTFTQNMKGTKTFDCASLTLWNFKGIGSILYLKSGLKTYLQKKNYKIISEVMIMRYVHIF
jgi:hypothetical protein